LSDSSVDPIVEEKRRLRAIRQILEKDEGHQSLGPADAPVTIVVFSDFECPFCKKLADTLKEISLNRETAHQVRIIFRNMPLDMHSWAELAAETAACVQMQDSLAFWNIHDYLFAHQRELNLENIQSKLVERVASIPNVRAEQVKECVDKRLTAPRIQNDLSLAKLNSVRATPTFFVNGFRVEGAATREHLLTLIQEALNLAHSGQQ
jgi:protein-disulfide isomerase